EIGEKLLASTPLYPVGRMAEKLLAIDRLDSVYAASKGEGPPFFENLLHHLGIRCECPAEEVLRIPEKGPGVGVSNHPFGLAEAAVLAALISGRRKDFRFLANSLLSEIDSVREHLLAVDPFGGRDAKMANFRGLRAAIEWLRDGGLLVVFPSGEVSSLQVP